MAISSYGRHETLIQVIEAEEREDRATIAARWIPNEETVGACKNDLCGYVRTVPFDAINEWCDSCGTGSVVSILVLLGLVGTKEVDCKRRRK